MQTPALPTSDPNPEAAPAPSRAGAWADLLRRQARVARLAWRHRHENDPPARLPHETEFLPAAMALQDTPPPPAPRVAMGLIVGFALIALAWSVIGRVDVVASARGRLVPVQGSQVVQPLEAATVRAILVREGEAVRAGQTLVELDASVATADRAQLESELVAARLTAARARALLASLDAGGPTSRPPALPDAALAGVPAARRAEAQELLRSEHQELLARRARLDAELARIDAEHQTTLEAVRKLEQTLPLAERRARDFRELADEQFVSRHGYLDREQQRIERGADLASLRSRLQEIEAGRREVAQRQAEAVAQARRQALDTVEQQQRRAAVLEQDLRKAETRGRQTRLTAPVDGTVQQLAVRTVGGVVTPAQPLMVIVPQGAGLEIEALVENKDIGFVKPGQAAVVKVDAFPFTRHGTLPGRIVTVSHDAVRDERLGAVFAARVRLERERLDVDGVEVGLSAGMTVTVEARLGERRLIDYVLSPLREVAGESLRER